MNSDSEMHTPEFFVTLLHDIDDHMFWEMWYNDKTDHFRPF